MFFILLFIRMHKPISPHGDIDHMGESINLVNNFKVENVIFNCGPYNDLEKELIKEYTEKIFEDIKYIDENGSEYWLARDLMPLLEYSK